MIPLINGVSYSWADIILNIMGQPIAGVSAINYSDKREKQDNHGAGANPVARTYGKKTSNASITLDVLEVEALQNAAPDGDISRIPPFTVPVCFVNEAGVLVTHKLMNVEFLENKRDMKRDDMEISIDLPLIVSHINWKA
jgi:hypothetical protein